MNMCGLSVFIFTTEIMAKYLDQTKSPFSTMLTAKHSFTVITKCHVSNYTDCRLIIHSVISHLKISFY
jgi:hypothetical protein